jgi:hypothetical protein
VMNYKSCFSSTSSIMLLLSSLAYLILPNMQVPFSSATLLHHAMLWWSSVQQLVWCIHQRRGDHLWGTAYPWSRHVGWWVKSTLLLEAMPWRAIAIFAVTLVSLISYSRICINSKLCLCLYRTCPRLWNWSRNHTVIYRLLPVWSTSARWGWCRPRASGYVILWPG